MGRLPHLYSLHNAHVARLAHVWHEYVADASEPFYPLLIGVTVGADRRPIERLCSATSARGGAEAARALGEALADDDDDVYMVTAAAQREAWEGADPDAQDGPVLVVSSVRADGRALTTVLPIDTAAATLRAPVVSADNACATPLATYALEAVAARRGA